MENFTLNRWSKADYEALTAHLLSMKDPAYKDFHQKLIPGVENFIGVRTPAVKSLAKEIAKGDAESFLQVSRSDYYEQIMLEGLVIGADKCGFDVFWERIFAFVPKIDNWAVNDSFCAAAKMVGKHLPESLPQVDKLLCSDNPWQVRAGIILLLDYYVREEWIDEILPRCTFPYPDEYYVKMGLAWLLSVCYVKFEDKTLRFLSDCPLDDFTYNKALQKILESNRVSKEKKAQIRKMKRQL